MRNKADVTKRQSEKVYFKGKYLENGNQKDFWKTFNLYLSNKYKTSDNIVRENGVIVNKPDVVCNIFQKHFVSATDGIVEADHFDDDFTIECVQQAITSYHNHPSITSIRNKFPKNFSFKEVQVENVLQNMKNVNTKQSTGYDNISPCFIKIAVNELACPITNIINHCIVNNHYPDSYKRVESSPLYKAYDRYYKDNYRPVSCLTTISKIVEYELRN